MSAKELVAIERAVLDDLALGCLYAVSAWMTCGMNESEAEDCARALTVAYSLLGQEPPTWEHIPIWLRRMVPILAPAEETR